MSDTVRQSSLIYTHIQNIRHIAISAVSHTAKTGQHVRHGATIVSNAYIAGSAQNIRHIATSVSHTANLVIVSDTFSTFVSNNAFRTAAGHFQRMDVRNPTTRWKGARRSAISASSTISGG